MKTVNTLSRRACLVWMWRHDPEARWYWTGLFLRGHRLNAAIADNYRDYGLVRGSKA